MISWNEYMEKAKEIQTGYIVAALTDEYIVDTWPMKNNTLSGKENRILEVRVFNPDRELKLIRSDISSPFYFRDSGELDEMGLDTYFEKQYLDIDTGKGSDAEGKVTATGGGKYTLPIGNIFGALLKLQIYVSKYEDSGHARVYDWRLCDFEEGK